MVDTHSSLKLSAAEESGPRGYIRLLFFFPQKNEATMYSHRLKRHWYHQESNSYPYS